MRDTRENREKKMAAGTPGGMKKEGLPPSDFSV